MRRREFKTGQLIDIVDGAQAVGRIHEEVIGVAESVALADEFRQRLDDEGGDFQRQLRLRSFALVEALPADNAQPLPACQTGRLQNLA